MSVHTDPKTPPSITDLRKRIDRLDGALLFTLAERFACTDEIGRIKRDHEIPALDAERERQQTERLIRLGDEAGLSAEIVEEVFSMITSIVRRRHETIRNDGV